MAIAKSVVFDKMKGSMGNITTASYVDNQVIVRSKATDVFNPNTPKQQAHRKRFSSSVSVAKLIMTSLRSFYTPKKNTHSPFNSFMQDAMNLIKAQNGVTIADVMPDLQVTRGVVPGPQLGNVTVSAHDAGTGLATVDIAWAYDAAEAGATGNDQFTLLSLCPATGKTQTLYNNANRDDEGYNTTSMRWLGGDTHVYAFFVNENTGENSDSVFIGTIV